MITPSQLLVIIAICTLLLIAELVAYRVVGNVRAHRETIRYSHAVRRRDADRAPVQLMPGVTPEPISVADRVASSSPRISG